jgi:superfamily II DNA or RNA helicase
MITIRRGGAYPYYFLNGEIPPNVLRSIRRESSYWVQNAERTTKFQRGQWNGYETLLYKTKHGDGTWFFPVGLLKTITDVLDAYGIEYKVIDPEPIQYEPLGLKWVSDKKLYDYQEEVFEQAKKTGSGVISLPTASGKTEIFLKLMEYFDLPTLIIVDSKMLMYQWNDRIHETFGLKTKVGLVGDNHRNLQSITIGITDSVYRMISGNRQLDFPVLCLDECHHVPASTVYSIALKCNAPYRYGLSATPRREDGADLKIWAATGPICANISPVDLIKRGILAKPTFVFEWLAPSHISRRTWQEAYDEYIVANHERNEKIVDFITDYVNVGESIYVHVTRIDHGKILSEMSGYPFLQGSDKTDRRQEAVEKFKSGEVPCLISTLLGEGYDVPTASVFINAASGKSSVALIQRVGRVLRTTKDKKEAVVIDFVESGRYFSKWWEQRYRTYLETYGEYVPR